MPRQLVYDEERLIDITMDLFWNNGFAATSIKDIVKATGVFPGSIYSAYPGKEALFLAALRKYTDANLLGRMPKDAHGSASISTWLTSLYGDLRADAGHRGCFLINTIADGNVHGDAVTAFVDARISDIEQFFRMNLEVAFALASGDARPEVAALTYRLLGATIAMLTLSRLPAQHLALTAVYHSAIEMLP